MPREHRPLPSPPCQWTRAHAEGVVLSAAARAEVHALWDQLADFSPQQHREVLEHCMVTIRRWIGGHSAFWIGAVRMIERAKAQAAQDVLDGWRIGCIQLTGPGNTEKPIAKAGVKLMHTGDPGDTTRALMVDVGRFRVYSMHTGFVDMDTFSQTAHYDYFYRQPGIVDRIWAVFPVNEDVESVWVFDTLNPQHRFTLEHVLKVGEALRGIKWFHRQLLMSHGMGISSAPLSPAERRLLVELLTGDTEEVIAKRLRLTRATLHQYATSVYRKLGVRGRTEFMALWLRGPL